MIEILVKKPPTTAKTKPSFKAVLKTCPPLTHTERIYTAIKTPAIYFVVAPNKTEKTALAISTTLFKKGDTSVIFSTADTRLTMIPNKNLENQKIA